MKPRIAIIGAGFAGLVLARDLALQADVTLFDKARGVGGRMTTRYAPPFYFDHGAPFFTVHSAAFERFLKPDKEDGTIQPWEGRVVTLEPGKPLASHTWHEPHFVACPNMNSLCKKWAAKFSVHTSMKLENLEKRREGWFLTFSTHELMGPFDWVLSTAPPQQTLSLFKSHIPNSTPMHTCSMEGCITLMVGLHDLWDPSWINAYVKESPLHWIGINSTKPGRSQEVTCIVAHSRNNWAELHMEEDTNKLQNLLLHELQRLINVQISSKDYVSLHRWRYARVSDVKKSEGYLDPSKKLGAIGDWCTTSCIEDVWIAASHMAARMSSAL